uniref:Uncharacterized protein n=1 Tax=Talaromyces marneffei PM1 TaxID=1077442 RepID=A0A093XQC0_TALMA
MSHRFLNFSTIRVPSLTALIPESTQMGN